MKCNKKFLAVAAAGVLTVATAVPALALENEFHGKFIGQYMMSNFNGSVVTDGNNTATYMPAGLPKNAPDANFFDSRARLNWIAKVNDNVKLVSLFEFDYAFWGNSSFTTGRNQGGALGSNAANFETKQAYLDLNLPSCPTNLKIGMQPLDDSFKGVFVSDNAPGILASTPFGALTTSLGFFRFFDSGFLRDSSGPVGGRTLGRNTMDFYLLDAKFKLNKETQIGGAYYAVDEGRRAGGSGSSSPIVATAADAAVYHTLGLNAETTAGPLTLDAFVLYQFGKQHDTTGARRTLSAFAGNVGAKLKVGPGTARTEFLYTSGDSDPASGKVKSFQSTIGAFGVVPSDGYYSGEMAILFRDKYAMTIDNAIVDSQNNMNQGVIAGTVGYDMAFTKKLSGSANAGFAAVAKSNGNPQRSTTSDSDYLGTEVNAELNYQVYDNVSMGARAAYVFLGNYYKNVASNGTPDDPYAIRLRVNYTF